MMRYIVSIFLLSLTSLAWAADQPIPGYIQAMLGELQLDDETVSITRENIDIEGEFDKLPYFGGAVQRPFKDDVLGYGWEGGGFISWKNDAVDYYAKSDSDGGTVRIRIDNSFLSFETFLGLYASLKPISRLRFYAGAGPLFMFARAETDNEDEDLTIDNLPVQLPEGSSSDTDFTVGWYSRAGVEFRLSDNTWLGAGVRHMETELDLSESVGDVDINGELYMLTITNRY